MKSAGAHKETMMQNDFLTRILNGPVCRFYLRNDDTIDGVLTDFAHELIAPPDLAGPQILWLEIQEAGTAHFLLVNWAAVNYVSRKGF